MEEMTAPADRFLQPASPRQRRYEALRARFVDGCSTAEAADRFGYAPGSFRNLCSQFLRSDDPDFLFPPSGPRPRPRAPPPTPPPEPASGSSPCARTGSPSMTLPPCCAEKACPTASALSTTSCANKACPNSPAAPPSSCPPCSTPRSPTAAPST